MSNSTFAEMSGTLMRDYIPLHCATERERYYSKALEENRIIKIIQFSADERFICTMIPIDAESFGYRGVLCISHPAPTSEALKVQDYDAVLHTPCLDDLGQLTTSELRVLYHIAQGISTKEIAETLDRSGRTIENQIAAIHNKLHTNSRAQLVKYAVDRGIHGFSEGEWELIIKAERTLKPMGS